MNQYRTKIYCCIMFLWIGSVLHGDFACNLHDYMWASFLQFDKRVEQAYRWYQHILRNDMSSHPRKGYLCCLYEAGDYRRIIQLMDREPRACDKDVDMQLMLARALRNEGQKKRAEEIIIQLSSEHKDHVEIVLEAVQIYMERKELDNALVATDIVLNNSAKRAHFFIFYFLRAQMYARLYDYDGAEKNLGLCLESNPNFDMGWWLQAVINEQRGDINAAIKNYGTYLEVTDKPDKRVQQHLMELLLRVNNKQNKPVSEPIGCLYQYTVRYEDIFRYFMSCTISIGRFFPATHFSDTVLYNTHNLWHDSVHKRLRRGIILSS